MNGRFIAVLLFVVLCTVSCSKEDSNVQPDYETAIIESITLAGVAGYDVLDDPGKPDLFFEIIFEPSTFVTSGMVIQDADLPVTWDSEIRLPGELEASYFIRFLDEDIGVQDDQIFAVTLRPNIAWPNTSVMYSSDGNEVTIQLRYE